MSIEEEGREFWSWSLHPSEIGKQSCVTNLRPLDMSDKLLHVPAGIIYNCDIQCKSV